MIFHNPAGLAGLSGTQIQINALGARAKFQHWRRPLRDPMGKLIKFKKVENTNGMGVVPSLFVSSDFGVDNLAVGLGAYVPFGAHIVYPKDGTQRYSIIEADLKNFFITPTVAYRMWDRLSIGVGFNYVFSTLKLAQANSALHVIGTPEEAPVTPIELDGMNQLSGKDAASFSATIGLHYLDPDDKYAIGLAVLLPTTADFKGTAHIESETIVEGKQLGEDFDQSLENGKRTDNFKTTFKYPMIVRAGLMVRPLPKLMLSTDINWQRWSSSYEMIIDFEKNPQLAAFEGATLYDVVIPQRWKNTFSVRAGAEIQPKLDLPLFLRVGALFDQSPVPDRFFDMMTPDSDKLGLSGGVGYSLNIRDKVRLDFDLAYLHLFIQERNIRPHFVGPKKLSGNDSNKPELDNSVKNKAQILVPGSDKTILNKPAPSYHHGVTRGAGDLFGLTIGVTI